MALEAVVFQQDLFSHSNKELYNLFGGDWSYGFELEREEENDYKGSEAGSFDFLENQTEGNFLNIVDWKYSSSPPPPPPLVMAPDHSNAFHLINNPSPDTNCTTNNDSIFPPASRAKRRRSRTGKNKEELENQRMTHIAVERNRRKQMNEYLSVLRSLMPESYVQRGDQASIIGGAINYVKELEQKLQLLGAHNEVLKEKSGGDVSDSKLLPFSEFFTFPQYSTTSSNGCNNDNNSVSGAAAVKETMKIELESEFSMADIEVTMVESHASLKIRSKRRPKQLLKVVSGLQIMRLTILHLNVTTFDQTVLYSISVKVEDDCKLTSVDDIATAVYQMLGRIQEESMLLNRH